MAQNPRSQMMEIAAKYINSSDFVSDPNNPPPRLNVKIVQLLKHGSNFDDWLVGRRPPVSLNDLSKAITEIFSINATNLIGDQQYIDVRRLVADSLIAVSINSDSVPPQAKPKLVRMMRLFGLLERVAANDDNINEQGAIEIALKAIVLLPPDLFPIPPMDSVSMSSLSVPVGAGQIRPIGIADLLVVRQEIQRYEAGDIAHIENVLKGETKERTHRRKRATEETFFTETERTEDTEKELESTERFELQTASQEVISEDTSVEAGITVSASYGPWVEVEANASYAHNTAREQSNSSATSYSQDVTERSISRIQERVLERRSRRTVEEIEETNLHRLSAETEHVIGIYRWLDKIYKAQVVNYGRRLIFEFIIPEPAAFLRYVSGSSQVEGVTVEEPEPPGEMVDDETFIPLAPDSLTPDKYLELVAQYRVPNVTPPPPETKTIGKSFKNESQANQPAEDVQISDELTIPDGYLAKKAWVRGHIYGTEGDFEVTVGRTRTSTLSDNLTLDDEDGVIPIAIATQHKPAYAITVEVKCELSPTKLQEWQQATYDAIIIAYQQQKAEFDEQVAFAQVGEGIAIEGHNPASNRETERTELRKWAIMSLTAQNFDLFNAMQEDSDGAPLINLPEADAEGRYIQFFEQAFEWTNMTYVFYPYFWGLKQNWAEKVLLEDNDPLFARFLQAGAARVQVPVRTGYNHAVLHYFQTGGEIWEGGDPPHVDDELYLSIVDEIMEEQGAISTPEGATLSVTTNSAQITGSGTNFIDDHIDREIVIEGERYRITSVDSPTSLNLTEGYRGDDNGSARYSIGVKFVGQPWDVRVPTSLVVLQEGSDLPDWTHP